MINNSKEAFELIQNSEKILLHLHVKPDKDSIGSALATYHALRSIGKDVTVIKGDSELPKSFSFIPGYNDIVLKNYFEIDLDDFDLFIIQDSGSKELISQKGEVVFPSNLKTLVIDHHSSNIGYADINIIEPSYSAVSELLFELFTEWNIKVDTNIAACLFVGIYGDTGGFIYASTTIRTMKTVAQLTEIYPEFLDLIHEMEYNLSKEEIIFEGIALSSIETYFNDEVAISTIPYQVVQKLNIKREDLDNNKVASHLVKAKEWEIGITMIEKEPNVIGISFRSRGIKDVSKIALKVGGGGHKAAAGATMKMSLDDARKKVLEAIKETTDY
jgi:bifunctional oligoribonuclease and PAP phosphatase NrnA